MRWLVALALLAVACRASWPTLPSLSDTVRNLFEDSEAERPVRPVRLMRREREEQDEEHHQQSRQTVLCSGVGQQITTENICGAGDCRATGFRCPGSSQTVAVPVRFGGRLLFWGDSISSCFARRATRRVRWRQCRARGRWAVPRMPCCLLAALCRLCPTALASNISGAERGVECGSSCVRRQWSRWSAPSLA